MNTVETREREYLSILDAAFRYSVSPNTLRRMLKDGRLTAYRPTGHGKILLSRAELERAVRALGEPTPAPAAV
jgi:excisionase family DNA binding protein